MVSSTSSTPSSCPAKLYLVKTGEGVSTRDAFLPSESLETLRITKANRASSVCLSTHRYIVFTYPASNRVMRHKFQAEQWIPHPIDVVFSFFANPENLPLLMPEWQRARIDEAAIAPPPARPASASSDALAAGAGTRMTLSFRPFPHSPLRVSWEAEISEFEWNHHFCDIQLRGPFSYWRHCHRLQSTIRTDDSGTPAVGTLLLDSIEYELPLGAIGDLADDVFIARQMAATFEYRQQRTLELLPLTLCER